MKKSELRQLVKEELSKLSSSRMVLIKNLTDQLKFDLNILKEKYPRFKINIIKNKSFSSNKLVKDMYTLSISGNVSNEDWDHFNNIIDILLKKHNI